MDGRVGSESEERSNSDHWNSDKICVCACACMCVGEEWESGRVSEERRVSEDEWESGRVKSE